MSKTTRTLYVLVGACSPDLCLRVCLRIGPQAAAVNCKHATRDRNVIKLFGLSGTGFLG